MGWKSVAMTPGICVYMYSICTVYVQYICTVYVQYIYIIYIYIIHIQCEKTHTDTHSPVGTFFDRWSPAKLSTNRSSPGPPVPMLQHSVHCVASLRVAVAGPENGARRRSMGFNQAKTYEIATLLESQIKWIWTWFFLLECMETGKYVVFHTVSRSPSKQEIAFGKCILCRIEIPLLEYGVWEILIVVIFVQFHRVLLSLLSMYIATDKHLEHHLENFFQNRHSGDVLSMKSL